MISTAEGYAMKALVIIASAYGLFASSAFLLGELFFAHFSISASIIGVAGILACIAGIVNAITGRVGMLAAGAAIVALAGVAANVFDYYANLAIPGNYYAWFLVGPLCVALALIAYGGWRRLAAPAASPSK